MPQPMSTRWADEIAASVPTASHPVNLRQPSGGDVRRRVARTIETFGPRLGPVLLRRRAGREVPDAELARAVRRSFQRQGATYMKLGQLVASAPGVFGPEIAEEFRALLDGGHPVPFDRVRSVVERETGQPLDVSFESFDPDPIGCASIAVVHRATLPGGRVVAVKVTRPGIRRKVATDLDIMRRLLPLLASRLVGGNASLVGPILGGLREQLSEELDLRNEARTMEHFRDVIASDPTFDSIVVPEVIGHLSGSRVLVMEFIEGVPIDDVEEVGRYGFDPKPLVHQMVKSWFATAVRDGVFHADVHAGNLLLTPDGRVGVLDWGIVGRLSADTHDHLRSIIAAALGDEDAWGRVTARVQDQIGPLIASRLGIDQSAVPGVVRAVMSSLLTRPFGEVQLSTLFVGPGGDNEAGLGFVAAGRAAAPMELEFDRGMFLLGKQLLYFERYGKMYLSDVSLVSDRDFFASLLE